MLTQEDINTLLEAVDMWKDMMQVLLSGEDKEQVMARMRSTAEEARRKHVIRKEQGILLQAKLIQMRDKLDIQDAFNSVHKGEPPAEIPESP